MFRKTIILLLIFAVTSCGPGKKKRTYSKTRTVTVEGSSEDTSPRKSRKEERINEKAEAIIATAMTFSGTRYKYGGTTNKGNPFEMPVTNAIGEVEYYDVSDRMVDNFHRLGLSALAALAEELLRDPAPHLWPEAQHRDGVEHRVRHRQDRQDLRGRNAHGQSV